MSYHIQDIPELQTIPAMSIEELLDWSYAVPGLGPIIRRIIRHEYRKWTAEDADRPESIGDYRWQYSILHGGEQISYDIARSRILANVPVEEDQPAPHYWWAGKDVPVDPESHGEFWYGTEGVYSPDRSVPTSYLPVWVWDAKKGRYVPRDVPFGDNPLIDYYGKDDGLDPNPVVAETWQQQNDLNGDGLLNMRDLGAFIRSPELMGQEHELPAYVPFGWTKPYGAELPDYGYGMFADTSSDEY